MKLRLAILCSFTMTTTIAFTIHYCTGRRHTEKILSLESTTTTSFEFDSNNNCINPKYFIVTNDEAENNDNNDVFSPSLFFIMKNVPGDGDCMFLAVAMGAAHVASNFGATGGGSNSTAFKDGQKNYDNNDHTNIPMNVQELRKKVAGTFLLGNETQIIITPENIVAPQELLRSAAKSEQTSPLKYIRQLIVKGKHGGLYGGGPELAIMSHLFQRPISIYELDKQNTKIYHHLDENSSYCAIQHMGTFGIPKSVFETIHVLVLTVPIMDNDNQFFDGTSVRYEKHACVLLPQVVEKYQSQNYYSYAQQQQQQ